MPKPFQKVAITGGAGYVGSVLVPILLNAGYDVKVIDLFLYGEDVFKNIPVHQRLTRVRGDIRSEDWLTKELKGTEALIHLACISNDPSFELNPRLGKSINYDAFFKLLRACRENRIQRLIYASSSSVYGVKKEKEVREESLCEPLTDYSRYKVLCERALAEEGIGGGDYVIVRPATVCGWSPRLRLDLTVNILTLHALVNKKICVFGGSQLRPNIHIQDMAEVYKILLEAPKEKISRQIFNAGYQNRSVKDLAHLVQMELADPQLTVEYQPSSDLRSYHINSDKINKVLGFQPRQTLEAAIQDLKRAHQNHRIENPLENPKYYNIKMMQRINLQ